MLNETRTRARNDALLHAALKIGNAANMNELEIFERLVNYLLDLKDEAFQEKLTKAMLSPTPFSYPDEPEIGHEKLIRNKS